MKKIFKNKLILPFIFSLSLFMFNVADAVTVTELTAAKTCTWEKIRNICATLGPGFPYPTFETSGKCPPGSVWHSDKVRDSCTGERRCANGGTIWPGKTYLIPPIYQCTYISGANYGNCIGNQSAAFKYVTSYSYTTINGKTCSDKIFSPQSCQIDGVCGTKNSGYTASDTIADWNGDSWCSSGTPSATPSFPAKGSSVSWTCTGIGAGHDEANCQAVRYLDAPIVELNANPNPVTNLNNNSTVIGTKDTDLIWSISNVADACGATPCNCKLTQVGVSTTSDIAYSAPSDKHTITLGSGSHDFLVTCTNSTLNTGIDNITVQTSCNAISESDPCDKPCGEGQIVTHNINASCNDNKTYSACNNGACPIEAEFREVRP